MSGPRWNPRDLPGVALWDASTYRPGRPWRAKRPYSRLVRWARRVLRSGSAS